MKLLIAIPALNEEGSVGIIERSLAARGRIIRESPVTDVQITVVSDGSTDRTAVLTRPFTPAVTLIEFAQNRGYGAAIKAAWAASDADLDLIGARLDYLRRAGLAESPGLRSGSVNGVAAPLS